ncbi:MAG: TIGR02300 family protein [Methyloceanibacter sp.]|nr:TIGR02300 family protein [Methyloceanibacter sp.]
MSKPAKGTKRVCASCGARFYDLSRTPIICPACQAVYQITPPPSRRGADRAAVQEAKPVPVPVAVAPLRAAPVIVSLDEADEAVAIAEEEEIVDLGDDEVEVPAAGDEDAFLEEPEGDEGSDVSSIVNPGKGEEG